jgi:hypothetical protein
VTKPGVAVENRLPREIRKNKIASRCPNDFSVLLDIFDPSNFDCFEQMDFFNAYRRLRKLRLGRCGSMSDGDFAAVEALSPSVSNGGPASPAKQCRISRAKE